MITLTTGGTLKGKAGTATAITYTIYGDSKTTTNSYLVLGQGQLPSSTGDLLTTTPVPASTQYLIKEIALANATGSPVTGITLYVNGTAAANQVTGSITIPANGTATYTGVWTVYGSDGVAVTTVGGAASGDLSGSYPGPTVAKINGVALSGLATGLLKNTTGTGVPSIASSVTDYTIPGRLINTTAPLTGGGDLSADRTIAISAASTSAAGSLSAADKLKLDNMYVDVTANPTALVNPANSASTNVTNMNTLMSTYGSGTTFFFPVGVYTFNAAWTFPSKFFYFAGAGQNRSGGESELQWTSNVAGNLITLTNNFWYTTFTNLTFSTTVDQTAGYCVQTGNNVGINFTNCSWATAGGYFNNCIGYDTAGNGGNGAFVDKCIIGGFKGTGVRVSSNGTSVVITSSQILGQWGGTGSTPASAMAAAGISGGWVGALQITDCDIIGCVNNLLLNPVSASSEVCASVFCTNTYFDNSGGSCIKITGTGATVRCRFDTCSFTTAGTNFTTAGTALSAVEFSSTFAYAAGGQGIDFVNCNAMNTFSTTGVTNGFLISGTADFSINNCRVAGWTGGNGIQITPIATAGRTSFQLNGNDVGPAGGLGANAVGLLLNAGSAVYGSMIVVNNDFEGNTTALTDNSAVAVGSQKVFYGNTGLVQKGALQLCTSAGAAVTTARGAVTASTTETFLFATKIPANGVSVGQQFRISIAAQESAAASVTFTIRAGPNGTIAGDTIVAATTAVAVALNGYIYFDGLATVVALGATGNVAATGFGTSAALPGGKVAAAEVIANAPTTAAWYLVVSGTSTAGVTTVREGVIEAL